MSAAAPISDVSLPSDSEVDLMVKVLSAAFQRPDRIPQGFMAYIADFLQTSNMTLLASQVVGAVRDISINASTQVNALETTSATAYGDLATVGPTISNLPDGSYLFFVQADMAESVTTSAAFMSLSFNGAAASDTGAVQTKVVALSTMLGYVLTSLSNNGVNTVQAKYKATGGTATFANRKILALRYGNP